MLSSAAGADAVISMISKGQATTARCVWGEQWQVSLLGSVVGKLTAVVEISTPSHQLTMSALVGLVWFGVGHGSTTRAGLDLLSLIMDDERSHVASSVEF